MLPEFVLVSFPVKPFNLAALKVGDFACKIILLPFISAYSSRTVPTRESWYSINIYSV